MEDPFRDRVPRKQMQQANHLLHFSLPQRPPPAPTLSGLPRRPAPPSRSKAVFVAATYRVVLSDWRRHEAEAAGLRTNAAWDEPQDPDQEPAWDQVEQLTLAGPDLPACPVCLEPPSAAEITRCGHIFCALCIRRHLRQDGGGVRECPICAAPVFVGALRPLLLLPLPRLEEGGIAQLVLLRRAKGGLVVSRVGAGEDQDLLRLPSPRHAASPFNRICATTVPVRLAREHRQRLVEALAAAEQEARVQREIYQDASAGAALPFLHDAIEELDRYIRRLPPAHDLPSSPPPPAPLIAAADSMYFYQAADGQPFFLHPFNVRCLLAQYGQLELCPTSLAAPIVGVEELTQSEATRKRYRHLSHLPLRTQFRLVELDLNSLLTPRVLERFSHELTQRAHDRDLAKKAQARQPTPPRQTVSLSADTLQADFPLPVSPLPSSEVAADSSQSPPNRPTVSMPATGGPSPAPWGRRLGSGAVCPAVVQPESAAAPTGTVLDFRSALQASPAPVTKHLKGKQKAVLAFSNTSARRY